MIGQELQELYTVFETLPSGLLIYTEDGTIVQMNTRAKELLQLDTATGYATLTDLPAHLNALRDLLENEREDVTRSEINLLLPSRKDHSIIGFTLKNVTLGGKQHGDNPARVFVFNDITHIVAERLALDKIKDELFQSKKLASMGTMVSGVAHELNNPLTGISMSTQLGQMTLRSLVKKLDPEKDGETISALEKALTELDKSEREAKRASALVSDLLNYSKPSQLNLSLEDPVAVIREMIQTIKSHPEFSQIQFEVGDYPEEVDVLYDRLKVEQVFYNLFKNASDAMERQGSITVSFSDEKDPTNDSQMIKISVTDNGPGIDSTVLNRIFDPFFTTKGSDGVGLGLSISFRTIEQHGGLLSVESEKGKGTVFHVALPLFTENEIVI